MSPTKTQLEPTKKTTGDLKLRKFRKNDALNANFQKIVNFLSFLDIPKNTGTFKGAVQNVAELKAILVSNRFDKDIRLVEDAKALYRFDAELTLDDDGDLILQPDVGAGRWIKTSNIQGKIVETPLFIPIQDQTIFTLPEPYDGVGMVIVTVSGIIYDKAINFNISGTTLTWLDNPFKLGPSKTVCVRYQSANS